MDNVDPPYQGEKCMVFLRILAVARMVIWNTRKKSCMMVQTFLIVIWLFSLDIHLESKLDAIENAWVEQHSTASLVIQKGATLEPSFPPLPVPGDNSPGPAGNFCIPYLAVWCVLLPLPPSSRYLQRSSPPPPVSSFWGSWTHKTVIHTTHSLLCPSPCFFYPISLDPLPT